jgi:hypothetical protein
MMLLKKVDKRDWKADRWNRIPSLGGSKIEAANQLKWDIGWKREHKARRTFSGEADAALRRLLPPCAD